MLAVRAKISRFVDPSFPGWVECRVVDALGHEHVFVEKVPVLTTDYCDEASSYPKDGFIACIEVGRHSSDDAPQSVRIDTERPWGVVSTAGKSQFDVLPEQLCQLPQS